MGSRVVLRLYPLFLACLLSVAPLVAARAQDEISSRLIEDVKSTVEEIAKLHPPEESYYIGIGGSPTPVIALMQEAGLSAANVPASRSGALVGVAKNNAQYHENLFRHLDQFIPKPEVLGNRKLVVMDFTYSGASLMNFKDALEYYFKERGLHLPHQFVALRSSQTQGQYLEEGVQHIYLPKYLEEVLSNNSGFKQVYREYDSWEASKTQAYRPPQQRARYLELRARFGLALRQDPKFLERIKRTHFVRPQHENVNMTTNADTSGNTGSREKRGCVIGFLRRIFTKR
ncbi:MAG: hypothetical protein ACJ763_05615 [Bdellovibrionia bacterium]